MRRGNGGLGETTAEEGGVQEGAAEGAVVVVVEWGREGKGVGLGGEGGGGTGDGGGGGEGGGGDGEGGGRGGEGAEGERAGSTHGRRGRAGEKRAAGVSAESKFRTSVACFGAAADPGFPAAATRTTLLLPLHICTTLIVTSQSPKSSLFPHTTLLNTPPYSTVPFVSAVSVVVLYQVITVFLVFISYHSKDKY